LTAPVFDRELLAGIGERGRRGRIESWKTVTALLATRGNEPEVCRARVEDDVICDSWVPNGYRAVVTTHKTTGKRMLTSLRGKVAERTSSQGPGPQAWSASISVSQSEKCQKRSAVRTNYNPENVSQTERRI